jgi:hypothetical protein
MTNMPLEHSLGVRGVGSSNLPVPTIRLLFDGNRISLAQPANQEQYFDRKCASPTIVEGSTCGMLFGRRAAFVELFSRCCGQSPYGRILMSGQVILYFDDQADALRFALAAGSVMAGDDARATGDLVQETSRVSRIRLDAANAGKIRKPAPERVA